MFSATVFLSSTRTGELVPFIPLLSIVEIGLHDTLYKIEIGACLVIYDVY
jgi:hypothetical protein